MVDLPQHAGQIALIQSMMSGDFDFRDLFELQLLTPYWLGYSIILLLSQVTGIPIATKITVAIAVAAFPLSADRFLRSQNGNPYWSWLFIPCSFGFAFEWGFLNFLIAIPLGFLFLSRVSRLTADHTTKDVLALALWCHLLFLAHVLVLILFTLIATLLRHDSNHRVWFKRLLPFFSITPLFSIWFALKILNGEDTQGSGPWGLGYHRVFEFFPNMVALPPSINFVLPSILISTIGLIGYKINLNIPKTGPFLVYLILMLIGPNFLFGTFFVYNRFSHIGLPLLLLAATRNSGGVGNIKFSKIRKYAQLAIIPLSVTLIAYHCTKIISFSNESAGFRSIIEDMSSEQRVLGLVFSRNSPYFTAPVYLHFPVWYQAEKKGVVDFNFAYFFPQVVRYKLEARPPADPNFVWMPHTFSWRDFEHIQYEYFLVKHPDDISAHLFPENKVELLKASDDWRLYKRITNTDVP